ncbi:MAG: PAS domain S-box protein [Nitrospirae bacterium]|nr:PAS domain S-box protein [Nitrospirota bacterium]
MSSAERHQRQSGPVQRLPGIEWKEGLFQSLLEGLPDAVVIVDGEGRILIINGRTETTFGYNRSELLGRPIEILVPDRFRKMHIARRDGYISQPHTRAMGNGLELTGRCKDGAEFPVEISLSPVSVEGTSLVAATIRDITERKRMEESLRESERRFRDLAHDQERQLILSERLISFGELTASLAHEFNNPLGIVIGFAQDLLTEVDPSDPRYPSVKIIEEEARRCKKIIQDLLDFGRQTPPHFQQIDPAEMVQKSLDLLSVRFQKARVKVATQNQNGLPKVWVDPQQMGQVLVNLFFNAIEAMPDGGALTTGITATPSPSETAVGGGVIVTVTDTGQGITPDNLSKIFHPFFTTKSKKGMGLGLSICKSIMEAHGGRISAVSVPGRGATFRLHLPPDRRRNERHESAVS